MSVYPMKIHSYLERFEGNFFEVRVFHDLAQAVDAFDKDVAVGKDVSDLRTDKIDVNEDGTRAYEWL